MTKNDLKKKCSECSSNNNGWCGKLNTNNVEIKIDKCSKLNSGKEESDAGIMEGLMFRLSMLEMEVEILKSKKCSCCSADTKLM